MLTHKEWLRINEIILIIHRTEHIAYMQKYFLDAIQSLFPFDKAMFYLLEENRETLYLKDPVFINVEPSLAQAYEATFETTKYGKVALSTRRCNAYRDSDLLHEDIRTSSDVYQSFLKPNNIHFGGGMIVAVNGSLCAEITFFKSQDHGDFTEHDLAILKILIDHLEIRFRNEQNYHSDKSSVNRQRRLLDYGLTLREAEIADLISTGTTHQEISESLCISIHTVKKHQNNLFRKLNIARRSELILLLSTISITTTPNGLKKE